MPRVFIVLAGRRAAAFLDRVGERQRAEVEVPVVGPRHARAGLLAAEPAAERLGSDLPDARRDAGADRQGLVREGLLGTGEGHHVQQAVVAQVDDRKGGVDERTMRIRPGFALIDGGDDVGPVADDDEAGVGRAADRRSGDLEKSGQDLVTGGLGVPAGGNEVAVRDLGLSPGRRATREEGQAAEQEEAFHHLGAGMVGSFGRSNTMSCARMRSRSLS